MGAVLLLILAVIWIAVAVLYVRERVEVRPSDSIGDFRRRLHVLERSNPAAIPPAHSLRAGARRPAPVLAGPVGRPVARPVGMTARQRTIQRRRTVFLTLGSACLGSLLLGLLPPLGVLLKVHVLLDLLFVAYVALLVRMRNLAAEREMKVRFLAPAPGADPALLLRRSAN